MKILFGEPKWFVEINGRLDYEFDRDKLIGITKYNAVLKCERTLQKGEIEPYSQTIELPNLSHRIYLVEREGYNTPLFHSDCKRIITNKGGALEMRLKDEILKHIKYTLENSKREVSEKEIKELIKQPVEINMNFMTKNDKLF